METQNETAVTLLQVIRDKYREDETDLEFEHIRIAKKKTPSTSTVPGLLPIPQCLALNYLNISCPGDVAELAQLCCQVRELDVARNKFTSWEEVFAMLKCMEALHFLSLSANLLDHNVTFENNPVFNNITHLVLNNTQIPWSTVESLLLDNFPCVEDLHLRLNNYSTISISNDNTHKYTSLKTLHIAGNKLTEFEEVCKVGSKFPNLQTLYMAENQIEIFSSEDDIAASLCNLQCLSITKNLIKEWSELEKLKYFPKLIDVKLQYNPVIADYDKKERRQFAIAVLPERILRLNGSSVKEEERVDAERAFIRHYMGKSVKPSRFFELEAKHGKLDPLVQIDLTPVDPTVKIIIETLDGSDELINKETIMQITQNQTVGELKATLSRLTGINQRKMRLYHRQLGGHGDEELKFTTTTLKMRNVVDGDEIIIVPKLIG